MTLHSEQEKDIKTVDSYSDYENGNAQTYTCTSRKHKVGLSV